MEPGVLIGCIFHLVVCESCSCSKGSGYLSKPPVLHELCVEDHRGGPIGEFVMDQERGLVRQRDTEWCGRRHLSAPRLSVASKTSSWVAGRSSVEDCRRAGATTRALFIQRNQSWTRVRRTDASHLSTRSQRSPSLSSTRSTLARAGRLNGSVAIQQTTDRLKFPMGLAARIVQLFQPLSNEFLAIHN